MDKQMIWKKKVSRHYVHTMQQKDDKLLPIKWTFGTTKALMLRFIWYVCLHE